MKFLSTGYKWFLSFRLREIENLKTNPIDAQNRVLFELLKKAENTEWGRKYKYSEIHSLEDFQKFVPINTYEDLEPFIKRMMDGEGDVLWSGVVYNFSKSSGTTSRSKFIPVTRESLDDMYQAGRDELAMYTKSFPDTKLLSGKSLMMGGSLEKIKDNPEIFCGDVSAILMTNLPFLGEYWRTPSLETATMKDFEPKLECLAEETMKENVTSITGVPTWTLALIRKILDKTGKKNIHEVWPNLEVFFHGAVSFEPYRKIFQELAPLENMHYMEAYNASEGFFGIQDDLSKEGEMWLVPDYGIFYEFIPLSDLGKEDARIYTMQDVKMGVNYAVIISTNAGLWRYLIGDTVMFTSLFPHRIKITGRTKHFINAFGEEVMVHNTDQALKEVCANSQIVIIDYTVAPMYMGDGKSGAHEWVIEFEKEPADMNVFKKDLDNALRQINSDYDAKRHKDLILKELTLHTVPLGTFQKWLKDKNKLSGQSKVPRLSNNREYIEEILTFLK